MYEGVLFGDALNRIGIKQDINTVVITDTNGKKHSFTADTALDGRNIRKVRDTIFKKKMLKMQEKMKLYKRNHSMKTRLISLALVLSLVLTLAACSAPPSSENDILTSAPDASAADETLGDSSAPGEEIHILLDEYIPKNTDSESTATTGQPMYGKYSSAIAEIVQKYNEERNGKVIIDTITRYQPKDSSDYASTDGKANIEVSANDPIYKKYVSEAADGNAPDIILFAPYASIQYDRERSSPFTELL